MSNTTYNIKVNMGFEAFSIERVTVPTSNDPDNDAVLAKEQARKQMREKVSQAYLNTDSPVEVQGLEYNLTSITTVLDKSTSGYVPMPLQRAEPDEEQFDDDDSYDYDDDYSYQGYTPMTSLEIESAQDYTPLKDSSTSDEFDIVNYLQQAIENLRRLSNQTKR